MSKQKQYKKKQTAFWKKAFRRLSWLESASGALNVLNKLKCADN